MRGLVTLCIESPSYVLNHVACEKYNSECSQLKVAMFSFFQFEFEFIYIL
jgi:hypothetical protein